MHDVIIIGAGPSGLTVGSRLSAAGHDVVLVEEHATVGSPTHCCGLVALDAFDELGLPKDTIRARLNAASFHAPNGQAVLVESERVRAAVIDRSAFDRALADRAVNAGTELRLGSRVCRIHVTADHTEVRLAGSDDCLYARACVLACGATYQLHDGLGLGRPRNMLQAMQVEVPFPCQPVVQVWLGRRVAPGGFGWVVPLERDGSERARIGLMCQRGVAAAFRTFAVQRLQEAGLDAVLPNARPRVLPLGPIDKTYGHRILAVGDAAGLVKPTTGGGIYYGVISAGIAADVLDECLRRNTLDDVHLQQYEQGWRHRLAAEIRAAQVFRTITARLADGAIDALVELARTDGIVPLLKQHADFNWHGAAALALLRNRSFRRIAVRSFVS